MKKTACALGFFDGVHMAHSQILCACAQYASANNLISSAVTFKKAPREQFGEKTEYLTTFEQKTALIKSLGIDDVFALNSDTKTLSMSPEDFFCEILVKKLHAAAIFCGFNYSFGSHALGNADTLARLCDKEGIKFFETEPMYIGSVMVSSSEIRRLLSMGDMKTVAKFLTRPFEVVSIVDYGKQLGRQIGFPTANIYPPTTFVSLPYGVYATKTLVHGTLYPSVTNVGVNPTVMDSNLRIETNIIGFDDNIYGEEIKVQFFKYIRKEVKFNSIDELKNQIARDKQNVINLFSNDIR